jgi:Holliday junction resolvasome RuvABC endonuclease subunit
MKVLSLDLSTKSSGYAIYNDKELEKYGCISAGSSNLFNRIEKMVKELNTILVENKIDKVVIEEVLLNDVHNNQSVFKALIYLQAFVCKLLNDNNLTPEFVVASHWRKLCGIKTGAGVGRESLKEKDIQFVKDQFGLNVNDDIADAICIGFAAVGGIVKKPQVQITDDGFEFM